MSEHRRGGGFLVLGNSWLTLAPGRSSGGDKTETSERRDGTECDLERSCAASRDGVAAAGSEAIP